MRRRKLARKFLLGGVMIVGFALSFLLFSTRGSRLTAEILISRYVPVESFEYKQATGNLAGIFSIEKIVLEGWERFLPEGSVLAMQRLDISFSLLPPVGLEVSIHNGVLRIPGFDNILFYGSLRQRQVDMHLFSRQLDIRRTLDLAAGPGLADVRGAIKHLSLNIKGDIREPRLIGAFDLETLGREGFKLSGSSCELDLHFGDVRGPFELFGTLHITGGEFRHPRAALVKLQDGRIRFDGDPARPGFDINAISVVEDIRIRITLTGTLDAPDLELQSVPPLPPERLLLMLATNRSWRGTAEALSEGRLTADLAKEFVDYFIFAGHIGQLTEALSERGFSIRHTGEMTRLGVQRDITETTGITYFVERFHGEESVRPIIHRLGIEHELAKDAYLGLELESEAPRALGEDEGKRFMGIMLELKKRF